MQLKSYNLNIYHIFGFLILFFLPLKFFSIKVGVNLTFSRLFLTISILFLLSIFFLRRSGSGYLLPREYFSRNAILLIIYAFLSFLFSYLNFFNDIESSRVLIMAVRYFEWTLILPVVFFLLLPAAKNRYRVIFNVVRFWRFIVFLAIIQFLLFLLGMPVSYESIGEPAPENQALLGNFTILRVNSFFGEPRVLASLIIPIMMFYSILLERPLLFFEKILIIFVGLITVSNTFFISLAICMLLRFLMGKSKITILFYFISSILLVFIISFLFSYYSTYIFELAPRLSIISEIIGSDLLEGAGDTIEGDLAAQISDFMFLPYIFSGYFISIEGFLGHGLGSSQIVLKNLADLFFGFSNPEILFGTRFIVFILLLDIGFLGCFIFLKIFLNLVKKASSTSHNPHIFKYYSFCIVAVSLFNDTYFFIVYFIFLSVLCNLQDKKLKPNLNSNI